MLERFNRAFARRTAGQECTSWAIFDPPPDPSSVAEKRVAFL
jgi:hypothetical protein